jgi:hypothetical protein
VPGFAAALAYYDSIRAPRVNAALTQGLRDFFGAHTYQRTDAEGTFHTSGLETAARSGLTDAPPRLNQQRLLRPAAGPWSITRRHPSAASNGQSLGIWAGDVRP